ncbi:hypothetical protein V9T40_004418 [Parthenolecanium corni]|uniref:Uncharacterized protein n=1 Tax=Parthenolecanium corni TaxID=536013 RepID=A0AAN9YB04_9HEMI
MLCRTAAKLRFLHRIKLFGDRTEKLILEDATSESDQLKKPARNQRCMACNPAELPKTKPIPEERIPWQPKVIREFIDDRRDDRTWFRNQPNHRCHTSIPIQQPKPPTRPKPLLRLRSRTEPNISCIVSNQKSSREKPLTVVLKFPQSVQVALNASIK